jgi:hypothetical protein
MLFYGSMTCIALMTMIIVVGKCVVRVMANMAVEMIIDAYNFEVLVGKLQPNKNLRLSCLE